MKKLLKKFLPSSLIAQINNVRMNMKSYNSNPPVAQMYLLDDIDSRIGINNFFSVIEPLKKINATAVLEFYDANGKKLLDLKLELNKWLECGRFLGGHAAKV